MIARYCLLGTVGHIYDHRSYHRNKFMNMINPCPYVTQALTALSNDLLKGRSNLQLCVVYVYVQYLFGTPCMYVCNVDNGR